MPYKDDDVRKEKSAERWKTWAQRNPVKTRNSAWLGSDEYFELFEDGIKENE
jgi:hypothetical protein